VEIELKQKKCDILQLCSWLEYPIVVWILKKTLMILLVVMEFVCDLAWMMDVE
jgi:hypothetical protein